MANGKTTYSEELKAAVIYGLRDKNSKVYFYVGTTKENPQDRLAVHLYEVENGYHKNAHFTNKAKKIGFKNIVCDILEISDLISRWSVEKKWIKSLLESGHNLVNRIHNDIEPSLVAEDDVKSFLNKPKPACKYPQLQKQYDELYDVIFEFLRNDYSP